MTIEIGYLEVILMQLKQNMPIPVIKTYKMNVRTYFFSCNAN